MLALALSMQIVWASGQSIHVDASATGGNDGSSWADAFTDLQDALAVADSGDQILMAAGRYLPTDDPADRSASFNLVAGVDVYGGFPAGGGDWEERDPYRHVTVLSGDLEGNDLTDEHGVTRDADDIVGNNSYTVVRGINLSEPVMFDGLVISAGLGVDEEPNGGGMTISNSGSNFPPVMIELRHIRFYGNRAVRGGGLHLGGIELTLHNSRFSGNVAEDGGAARIALIDLNIRQVVFHNNRAEAQPGGPAGGALYLIAPRGTIRDVVFVDNQSTNTGGAVRVSHCDNRFLEIRNALFYRNSAQSGGGAIRAGQINCSEPEVPEEGFILRDSVFMANVSEGWSGGAIESSQGSPTYSNLVLVGNESRGVHGGGGAIFITGVDPNSVLTNLTVAGNRAANIGGAIMFQDQDGESQVEIRNSIIWNNSDSTGTDTPTSTVRFVYSENRTLIFRNSLVASCWSDDGGTPVWNEDCGVDAGGNLADQDPQFVIPPDPEDAPSAVANVRLLAGSPLRNAGDHSLNPFDNDVAGNVRVQGGNIDLGAYEHIDPSCPASGILYVSPEADAPGDGREWGSAFRDLQDALAVSQPCEIHVAEGVYRPTDAPGDAESSFVLAEGVAIHGGFPHGGDWEVRDWQRYRSVLSGDITYRSGTDGDGLILSPDHLDEGNSIEVVYGEAVGASAVMDGFHVTGGNADRAGAGGFGGGMRLVGASPMLTRMHFVANQARGRGAALYHTGGSQAVLKDVQFTDNRVTNGSGGAIMTIADSPVELINARFTGNQASSRGGAIFNQDSDSVLINTSFKGNAADSHGGVIYNTGASPMLINVSISGNASGGNGGGIRNWNGSNSVLVNTIIWNNSDASGTGTAASSISNSGSDPVVSYSLIQGCKPAGWNDDCGSTGGNNLIDADPQFMTLPDPDLAPAVYGDLKLDEVSPARNAGSTQAMPAEVETDLAGNPRLVGTDIDLGAYEFNAFTLTIEIDGQGSVLVDPEQSTYAQDEIVALTAVPEGGYVFSHWSGAVSGDQNPIEVLIDGETSVTATFGLSDEIFGDRFE